MPAAATIASRKRIKSSNFVLALIYLLLKEEKCNAPQRKDQRRGDPIHTPSTSSLPSVQFLDSQASSSPENADNFGGSTRLGVGEVKAPLVFVVAR